MNLGLLTTMPAAAQLLEAPSTAKTVVASQPVQAAVVTCPVVFVELEPNDD